MLKILRRN